MDRQASESRSAFLTWDVFARCFLLACAVAPVAVGIPAVYGRGVSAHSMAISAVAFCVCWLAASSALVVTCVTTQSGARVQGVLLAMLLRMALPMAALVALPNMNAGWREGGLAPTILGTYLICLLTETVLVVRWIPMSPLPRTT